MTMAHTIQGDFTRDSLRALLQFLASSQRNGTLKLRHTDWASATLVFQDGRLIAAIGDNAHGEEALFRTFTWDGGSFEFDRHRSTDMNSRDRIDQTLESLLIKSLQFADAAPILNPTLNPIFNSTGNSTPGKWPEAGAIPHLNALAPDTQVQLSGVHFRMLGLIDARRTLTQIANESRMSLREAQTHILHLEQLGVVVFEDEITVIADAFLIELQHGLTRIVGPVADMLIDDLMVQAGFDADRLEVRHALMLLRALRNEVSVDQRTQVEALGSRLMARFEINA
jgi:hypothetical protein